MRGTQINAIASGGSHDLQNVAETWDGTSWTEVNDLNTPRYAAVAGGSKQYRCIMCRWIWI